MMQGHAVEKSLPFQPRPPLPILDPSHTPLHPTAAQLPRPNDRRAKWIPEPLAQDGGVIDSPDRAPPIHTNRIQRAPCMILNTCQARQCHAPSKGTDGTPSATCQRVTQPHCSSPSKPAHFGTQHATNQNDESETTEVTHAASCLKDTITGPIKRLKVGGQASILEVFRPQSSTILRSTNGLPQAPIVST